MRDSLRRYAKRYDVLFVVFGTALTSGMIYLKDWPGWALLIVMVLREFFGYMALLSKERDDA
jgi:hypothetical protein